MSPVIYIIGTLLVLFQVLSRGAATQQEELAIRIYYGTTDQREISNATTINVTDTDSLLLLRFVGDTSILDMTTDTSNLITSYRRDIKQRHNSTARMTDTLLLKVTGSGEMTVFGVRQVNNIVNHYKIILYFDVQRDPTTSTMTMTTEEVTTTKQVTVTYDETTSDAVTAIPPAASIQVEQSTLVSVAVVVVVITLVLCSVIVVAVVMAIHYRNRLKDLQQQRANDSTSQTP